MTERLRLYWDFIRASLWFIPLLMSTAAVVLAVLLLTWVGLPDDGAAGFWLFYNGDADNARRLLAALLSAMITMSSLVVSITVVVLTLAAGQLGPRMVRNFMGDRSIQTVIGLFVSTILYLLVVLRTIGGTTVDEVPHLAVSVGTGLSVLCLFVLLFYVHRLARSIMYDNAVRDVATELMRSIDRLVGDKPGDVAPAGSPPGDAAWIGLGHDGYVQAIEFERLAEEARRADAILWLAIRPGDHVLERGKHIAIHPSAACEKALADVLCRSVVVGTERTPTQDLEYGIRQLVEIALRALSPGINDVFTAITVIDNLTAALARLFSRPLEPAVRRDADGRVRVHCLVIGYEEMLQAAFGQIRHSGRASVVVLLRLADAIYHLAPYADAGADNRAQALRRQLLVLLDEGERHIAVPDDLHRLRQSCQIALACLEERSGSSLSA